MAEPHIGRSRLPELFLLRSINQAEFARRLGVSESFISKVISGIKVFSLERAKKAADILNCSIEDLHEWVYY
jgi:transcriptional regulator with XRE-family HTH domain